VSRVHRAEAHGKNRKERRNTGEYDRVSVRRVGALGEEAEDVDVVVAGTGVREALQGIRSAATDVCNSHRNKTILRRRFMYSFSHSSREVR
jgi:hypothetical protein